MESGESLQTSAYRPSNLITRRVKALSIPEVFDKIMAAAPAPAQAASAQTCHYWSSRSLPYLWRRMTSFYPLLQLLSDLVCRGGAWVSVLGASWLSGGLIDVMFCI